MDSCHTRWYPVACANERGLTLLCVECAIVRRYKLFCIHLNKCTDDNLLEVPYDANQDAHSALVDAHSVLQDVLFEPVLKQDRYDAMEKKQQTRQWLSLMR